MKTSNTYRPIKQALAIILAMLLTHTLIAQVQIYFEEDTVALGDYIHLNAIVPKKTSTQYFFPEFKDSLGAFELITTHPTDTLEFELKKQYTIAQYYPGVFGLDSFPVFTANQGKIDTLYSLNPIQLFVKPIKIDTAQSFKPIVGPIAEPITFKELLPWLSLLLIPVLVIALFYILSKRKQQKTNAKKQAKTPIQFYGEALSALKALEQKKLWQNGNIKTYYFELSRIVRTYLEGRFEFQAMESTTHEIMDSMASHNIANGLQKKLKNTLQQADLAKFAKYQPLGDENSLVMKNAIDFVTHTKPITQPPTNNNEN